MTIQVFLSTTTGTEADDWQQTVLVLTSAGQRDVLDNFQGECRLDPAVWQDVFTVLPRATWAGVQAATTVVFRDHTLNGTAVSTRLEPMGRAITAERFKELLKASGLYPTDADADAFIRDLQKGIVPPSGFARQLATCSLGRYFMWSTFDDSGAGGDPFDGCSGSASAVRHAFGLVDPGPGMPDERDLVLCVYEVPDHIDLRCPTIADAYSGDSWNPMFRYAPDGAEWGTTSGGRPEVVHHVIQGDTLVPVSGVGPLRLVS